MRRAYKFLLRPTARQTQALAACLEDHRQLYNAALAERREAYRRAGQAIRYADQSGQLKDIRRADADQARWSFSSQQATLRRLNRAFVAFFRRVKAGQIPGYPRFKGRGWWDTVEWPKDGDGCRWNSTPGTGQIRVYLQGVGHVRVHAHRRVAGRVKTASIRREGRRWYVILSCDDVPAEPAPPADAPVGIDLGVASFLTTSDGVQVESPHMTAGWLVSHHDLIAHEDLRIGNMTRSARGSIEAPGINVAAKSGLNRSILDAGWGVFLRILAGKAESAGRLVIAVDPRNTSRTCPRCGQVAAGNRPTQAEFRCVACGYTGHADVVGATDVLRAGLALRDGPELA